MKLSLLIFATIFSFILSAQTQSLKAFKVKIVAQQSHWNIDSSSIETNYTCEAYIDGGNAIFNINNVPGGIIQGTIIRSTQLYYPETNAQVWVIGYYDGQVFTAMDSYLCFLNPAISETELQTNFGVQEFFNITMSAALIQAIPTNITINNISPLIVNAGIGDTLTITGSGFDNLQGNGTVSFASSVEPNFMLADPHPNQYVSWSDTLIRVLVPSNDFNSTGYTSVSGKVKIISDNGSETISPQSLTINYSLHNIYSAGMVYFPGLANMNGTGGYTVNIHESIAQYSEAINTTAVALETWKNISNIDFKREVLNGVPFNNNDDLSSLRHDSLSTFLAGITMVRYELCGSDYYLQEIDIIANNVHTWNYGPNLPSATELDFQTFLTKQFGRFLMLEETNNLGSVMYYDWEFGDLFRIPNAADSAGATYAMDNALSMPSCGVGNPIPSASTGVGDSLDIGIHFIYSPQNGFCQGDQHLAVSIINPGIDTVSSCTIAYKIDGVPGAIAWAGSLAHNEISDLISIGLFNLLPGSHTIKVWTELPNGLADQFNYNDTITHSFEIGTCSQMNTIISMTSPITASCQGELPIQVELHVQSLSNEDLYGIEIHHSIDGVEQPVFYFSGTIAVGSASIIEIGMHNFVNTSTDIEVWTEYPNGIADVAPSNDYDSFTYTPDNLTTGTYTVAGVTPDYPTLADAIQDANSRGICGDVIFNVRDGIYNTNFSIYNHPTLNTPENTLTIQSESGNPSDVVFQSITIVGVERVVIKSITFTNSTINGSRLIHFEGNKIIGNTSSPGITAVGAISSDITIEDNQFNNVSSGVYFTLGQDWTITNNQFEGFTNYGVYAVNGDSLVFDNNTIYSNGISSNDVYGFYIDNCTGQLSINNNLVRTKGIALNILNTTIDSSEVMISNNGLQTFNDWAVVRIHNTINLNFYHNTLLSEDNPTTHALFHAGTDYNSNVTFKLNNLVNLDLNGTIYGGAYGFEATDLFSYLDYNNYYTASQTFSTYCSTFESFQTLYQNTIIDQNSSSILPEFQSDSSLRLSNQLTNYNLPRNSGEIEIPFDIDGSMRSQISYPGISEIQVKAVDAAINENSLQQVYCGFGDSIFITFENTGLTSITSTTLNWTENGNSQSPVNYSLGLAIGEDTTLYLGTIGVGTSMVNLNIWIQSVNGNIDDLQLNDSISESAMNNGMSGNYTVGAFPSNFLTIQDALTALSLNGICDEVHLQLKSATYNETFLTFESIPGISENRRVFIESVSGDSTDVIIVGTQYWSMNILEHVNFEHLKLDACRFFASKDLEFNNCILETCSVSSGGITSTINLRFNNCFMDQFWSFGSDPTNGLSNWGSGIISDLYFNECIFEDIASSNHYIKFKFSRRITINKCEINIPLTFDGSWETTVNGCYGNPNIFFSSSYYLPIIPQAPASRIFNNIFSDENGDFNLYLKTVFPVHVYHNTFKTTNGRIINISGEVHPDAVNIYGNIFNCEEGRLPIQMQESLLGTIGFDYNYYHQTSSDSIAEYSTTVPFGYVAINGIGQWQLLNNSSENSLLGLLDFEAPYSGHLTSNNTPVENYAPNIYGLMDDFDGEPRDSFCTIGADEQNMTHLPYDVGVFQIPEFLDLCSNSNQDLFVKLRNYGDSTLTDVDVLFQINGGPTQTFTWSGSLLPGEISDSITIGSTLLGTTFDTLYIKAWTNVIGQSDLNIYNDTAQSSPIIPRMNGDYTIGAGFDFTTVDEAILRLEAIGMCGEVFFSLSNGTHNITQPLIAYYGQSSTNLVHFRALNGIASDAILIGPTILNEGARNLRFEDINMRNDSWTDPYCVIFNNDISDIHFNKTLFTESNNDPAIYGVGSNNIHSIEIDSCTFDAAGVLFDGTNISNIRISYNDFIREGLISLEGIDSVFIHNNHQYYSGTPFGWQGLNITLSNNILIRDNIFKRGLKLTNVGFSINSHTKIVNNLFISGHRAFWTSNCNNLDIYHNTIKGGFANNFNQEVVILNGSNTNFINNNIYSAGITGKSVYFQDDYSDSLIVDYNNYFTDVSPITFQDFSGTYNGLTAYQIASSTNLNSVNIDPQFYSVDDYHFSNPLYKDRGTPVLSDSIDLDGDARSLSQPDIGADEKAGLDLMVLEFDNIICSGQNVLDIIVVNTGFDSITTFNYGGQLNNIDWNNSVWNGVLPPGDSATITISGINLYSDSTYYGDFWIDSPNGLTDENGNNDTLSLDGLEHVTSLGGNYTIGGVNPSFQTINDAVERLHEAGICDNVVFNIRSGIYYEQVIIEDYPGHSDNLFVTFQSELQDSSSVQVRFHIVNNGAAVFQLNDAKNIKIAHLNVFIENSYLGSYINVTGESNQTILSHCYFENSQISTSTAGINANFNSQSTANDSIIIEYCRFENERSPINVSGGQYNGNVVVRNSIIKNSINHAIYLDNISSAIITNNKISCTDITTWAFAYGISANHVLDSIVIINNEIEVFEGYGVWLNDMGKGSIVNNSIIVHNQANNLTSNLSGLYILQYPSNVNLPVNILHNSILVNDSYLGNNNYGLYPIMINGPAALICQNNAFINRGDLAALKYTGNASSILVDYNAYYTMGPTLLMYPSGNLFQSPAESNAQYPLIDANSVITNPLFVSDSNLHVFASGAMKNTAINQSEYITDIDGESRVTDPDIGFDEFNNPANELGFVLLNLQDTVCNTDDIVALIENFGTNSQSNIAVNWIINGVPGSSIITSTIPGESQSSVNLGQANFNLGINNVTVWFTNSSLFGDINANNDSISGVLFVDSGVDLISSIVKCDGEIATIIAPTNYASYNWSTGSSINIAETTTPGYVYLTVISNAGCESEDSTLVIFNPIPTPPSIQINGNTLSSSTAANYQWYQGGMAINGATNQTYDFIVNGNYYIGIVNSFGCYAYSDTVNVDWLASVEDIDNVDIDVYPNPTSSSILVKIINSTISDYSFKITDASGRVVYCSYQEINNKQIQIDMSQLESGFYHLEFQYEKNLFRTNIVKL